jgi:cobalamin-dependent methionine synthase I
VLIIADNLSVTDVDMARAIQMRDAGSVRELAHKVTEAGADVIEINLGPMRTGAAETMVWMVDQVQAVSTLQLSLDSVSPEAIVAGAQRAGRPPLVDAFSLASSRPADLSSSILPFVAEHGLEIVLPAMAQSGPSLDPDVRATQAQGLVEEALSAGVHSSRIYVDPVVVHVGGGDGQRHSVAVMETMRLLTAMFDPPLKTLAGVRYVSEGAPPQLRSALNRTYLAMLAALGLNAAIVDVIDGAMMRDIRLIRGLRNESLYSVSDAEL